MTTLYLWANAVIYIVFAILCTCWDTATSSGVGFLSLSPGGTAEYLTVYGGMELGLGVFFAWSAWKPHNHRSGLLLALMMYLPIALFRWFNILRLWPVTSVTLGVGTLEATLLVIAVALWFVDRLPAEAAHQNELPHSRKH